MAIIGETVASGGIAGQRTLPLPLGWVNDQGKGQDEANSHCRVRGLIGLKHGLGRGHDHFQLCVVAVVERGCYCVVRNRKRSVFKGKVEVAPELH